VWYIRHIESGILKADKLVSGATGGASERVIYEWNNETIT
jgi:hypothetical protein